MKNIAEIHNSSLYGIIIESGCSAAASSALMNEPGASKTIYKCEQPYSKEYQEEKYGKFKRSVSKEWIQRVLEVESQNCSEKVNFIFASNWQLLDPTNPLTYAHGWFGLFDMKRNVKHYLHFSFRRDYSKNYVENTEVKFHLKKINPSEEYIQHKYAYDIRDRKNIIDIIGKISCDILHTAIEGNINNLTPLDAKLAILDEAYINDSINYQLLINTLEKAKGDYFLVFDKGSVLRIEEVMRKSNQFVIQKGSFNPLHHGHLRQVTGTHEKYPEALPLFLISTYRYDKPHVNYEELKERIEMFEKAGYPLVICKSVLFYETFDLLSKWSFDKKFYFTVGYDTINRIYQTDLNEWDKLKPIIKNETFIDDDTYDVVTKEVKIPGFETFTEYAETLINKYKENFKFLIFERKDIILAPETTAYGELIEYIHVADDDGISSTKIRNGEIENRLKY